MADARVALGAVAVAVALSATLGCSSLDTDTPGEAVSPSAPGLPDSAASGDEPASAKPQAVARRVLEAWSRPDVRYSRWWIDLKPMLSAGARQTYAYTDPAAVPVLDLPAVGELTQGPHPGTATVRFETPDGTFGVDLARAGGKGPWRAERILFPDQPSLYAE